MTKPEFIRKLKAVVKRIVKAERKVDRANEAYDRIWSVAIKNGWKMPKTVLSNPLFPR